MSNRASFLKVSKEYRELAHSGALGRVFGGFANKLYARKKLAPINYKLSIAWKQHVMNLMKKQQTAQQKVNNLEKSWKKGMNPANFKSKLNAAKRNLEQAKQNTKQARKQKILTLGSTQYTKQGQVPRALPPPPAPVSFGPFLNRLVYIVNSKVPNVAGVLDDEFGKEYKFNPNKRVELRNGLGAIEGNKRLPRSIRMAARRRAIKLGRESASYNLVIKQTAKRVTNQAELLKKALNEKKKSSVPVQSIKASTVRVPTTRLNTIPETNGPTSHPLKNNPLYGVNYNNNNFQNAREKFSNNNNNSPSPQSQNNGQASLIKKATVVANNAAQAAETIAKANNLGLMAAPGPSRSNSLVNEANNTTVIGPVRSRGLGIKKAIEEITGSRMTRLLHESVKPSPSPPKPRRSLRNRARELRERITGKSQVIRHPTIKVVPFYNPEVIVPLVPKTNFSGRGKV